MASQKHRYDVYLVGTGEGCYAEDYCKEYVGSAWAVSPAQACNMVRFRNRDKQNPNGGYANFEIGDILDQGTVKFRYVAELCNKYY